MSIHILYISYIYSIYITDCVWHLVVWKSTLVENTSQGYPWGSPWGSLEGWDQGICILASIPSDSPWCWRTPEPSASWKSLPMDGEMRESPSFVPAQTFYFFYFVYEKNGITFLPYWWSHVGHLCPGQVEAAAFSKSNSSFLLFLCMSTLSQLICEVQVFLCYGGPWTIEEANKEGGPEP